MALVWKEISTQTTIDINNAGAQSIETLRIRRIWQLENNKANYDDENELGVEQLTNDFANMEYVNPVALHGHEWFLGDVIPFERCAYIVNINSDGANAFYTFIRLTTAVMWDSILGKKLVVT